MLHRISASCSLLLSTLLLTSPSWASPGIDKVSPTLVDYGKGGEVKVSLHDASPNTQLLIAPGGPHLLAGVDLPAKAQAMITTDHFIVAAAGSAGVLLVDPGQVRIIASYHDDGDYRQLAVSGDQVLAADSKGRVILLDIHDPAKPHLLHSAKLAAPIKSLSWHGAHAYALLSDNSMQIIDVAKLKVLQSTKLKESANALSDDGIHAFVADAQGLLILDGDTGETMSRYRSIAPALDVVEQNGLAFLALGEHGVLLLDVRDALAPRWVGSHSKLGKVDKLKVRYDRVLISNEKGQVLLLDISHPDQPTTWAAYALHTAPMAITMQGHSAWASTGKRLEQIDFSAQTPQLSNEGLDVGRGVNFGGERRAAIAGNVIYVADWFSGLHIYDITHPDHPKLFSSYHTPGSSKGVTVRDGIAYVADDDHGLQILDVHNPLQPKLIANVPTPGLAYIPKLVGNTIYLAGHRGGVQIIDVKNPAKPHLITSIKTPGMAWGIAVKDGIAYVADDQAGLLAIDVKDPNHTKLLSQFNPGGRAEDVMLRDGIAYVSFFDQGLYILDIHDPAAPKQLAQLQTPGNARGIALQGQYLYLADWLAGIEVIDIHDPTQPRIVGSYDTPGAAWGVNVQDDTAFVLDWWGGFLALSIKDPTHPVLAGRYHERGRVNQIAARKNFLFVANGEGGLQIFDDKNPLNPTWVTGVDSEHAATRVFLHDNTAYLGQSNGAVTTIDISNPFQSFEIGELDLPAPAASMAAKGDTAYFAIPGFGIVVADISTPRWPKEVARFMTPVLDMQLVGNTLYVLTTSSLLQHIDISEPRHPELRTQDMVTGDGTLLRSVGDKLVVYQPQRGLVALRAQDKGMQAFASFPFKGRITDMTATDNGFYAATASDGVYYFTLDDKDLRLQSHYPLLSHVSGVTQHDGTLYLSGESTITALAPLPPIAEQRTDANTVTLKFPPYTPLGNYNLVLDDDDGKRIVTDNALKVGMPRFSRPKITQQEFERLLKAYRARNPGAMQPGQ